MLWLGRGAESSLQEHLYRSIVFKVFRSCRRHLRMRTFRTSFLARARAHSRDVCRTCECKAMRRQFHDHSHVFFVVTLHHFSKSCYFSSQKHGFRFLAPCVALNFGIAVATCALARARSKVLQEVLICALARARSKVAQSCSHMSGGQILEFRFLEGNYRHSSHVVAMIAKYRLDRE